MYNNFIIVHHLTTGLGNVDTVHDFYPSKYQQDHTYRFHWCKFTKPPYLYDFS